MSVRWSEWGELEAPLLGVRIYRVGMKRACLYEKFGRIVRRLRNPIWLNEGRYFRFFFFKAISL